MKEPQRWPEDGQALRQGRGGFQSNVRRAVTQEERGEILTVTAHAHGEALLEPTVLAPVAVVLRHLAVLAAAARVAELFADRALEEALAALAADRPVMSTWCFYFKSIMLRRRW